MIHVFTGNSPQSYGTSCPVESITQTQCYLKPDRGDRALPHLSQKGWYSFKLPQRNGSLS